ncbi:MAG: phBC6A51 family helix-turn-helix protein [Alphaproteobacteria bacterium]|nr:phBC6A51 family helix-turn-helix protein [Alphaproteobacteria bacterium]
MPSSLKSKQLRAVHLLVEGRTQKEIAAILHLRRETLSRWKKQPAFQEAYELALQTMRDDLSQRLQNLAYDAISLISRGLRVSDVEPRRAALAMELLKIMGCQQVLGSKPLLPTAESEAETVMESSRTAGAPMLELIHEPATKERRTD